MEQLFAMPVPAARFYVVVVPLIVLLFLTDRSQVLYLPTSEHYDLLLSVGNGHAMLESLRNLKAMNR